jgi:hypothetical protein
MGWGVLRLLGLGLVVVLLLSGRTDAPTAIIAGSFVLLGPWLFVKLLFGLVMLVGGATSDR